MHSNTPPLRTTVTLSEVITAIGSKAVTPLGTFDPNHPVSNVEIYDALGDAPRIQATLLLVPQAQALSLAELRELTTYIQRHKCAGFAIKVSADRVADIEALSTNTGVAILHVAGNFPWSLFEAKVSRCLGENRPTEALTLDPAKEPLFGLVNELANYFGGSVVVEDLARRPLAYSSVPGQVMDNVRAESILLRQVGQSPYNDAQYRDLLQSFEIRFYEQEGEELPRTAIALHAGNVPLGTLWAIDPRPSEIRDTPETRKRVEDAASIAAAHILEALHQREASQLPREQRLRALITGQDLRGTELAELGFRGDRAAELIAFSPGVSDSPNVLAQLRAAIHRQLAAHVPEVVTVLHRSTVWALIPVFPSQRANTLVKRLVETIARTFTTSVRAALPGSTREISEISALAGLAEQMFAADRRYPAQPPRTILTSEQLKPTLLYSEITKLYRKQPQLLHTELLQMQNEEPQLAATLLCWCGNRGNIAQCAKELGVHENTVRSRIQKAIEKYKLAPDDPDEFFTIWVQLRTLEGTEFHPSSQ